MTEADLNGIPAQAEILPVAEAPSSTVLNKVKIMLGKLKDTSQSLDIFKAVGAKIDSEVSGCKNMAAELIVLSSTGASTASAPAPTATQAIPAQAEIPPVAQAPSSTLLNKVQIVLQKLEDTSQSLETFKAEVAKIDSEVSGCKNMAAELIVLSSTGASTASAPAPTATQAIPAQAEIPPVAQAPSSTLLNKVQIMLRELEETSRSLKIFKAVGAKIDFEVSGCKNMAEELIQTDVIGQAASNLVAGTTLDSTVQKILDIGGGSWDYDAVVRALRASSDNPDTAIEYLYSGIPAQAEIPPVAQAPSSTVLNKVQIVLQKLEDTSQSLETFKAEVAKIDSEVSGCKNMAAELIVLSSTGASTASAPAPTATQAIPAQAEIPPVAQAPSSTLLNKVQIMLRELEETSRSLKIFKAVGAKIDFEVSGCKNMAEELIQTDVIGQAASNLVAGTTLDSTVQKILDIGGGSWDYDAVVRALRASSDNPDTAIEYLYSGIPAQAEIPPVAQAPSSTVLNKVQIVLQKLEDTSQSLETFKAEVAKIDSEVSGCKNMAAELIVLSSTGASTASAPAPTATQAIPAQAEIPPVAQAPSSTVLNKVQTMLPKLEETSQSLEICKAEFAKIDSEVSGCKNMAEELIQRDVIGQAASNFVAGTTLDSTVQKPLAMGGCSWDHVVRALRASSDNPVIPPVAQDPSASSQVIPKLKPSLITASRIEKSFQLLKDMQPDKSYLHRQIKLGEAVDELRGKAPRRKEKFLLKKDSRTVKTTEKGTENLVLKKEAMSIDPEMFIEANSFTEQFDMSHPSKKSEKRGLREKTKKGMKSATEQRQSLPPEKSEGSVAEIEEEAKLREGIKPLVDEVADEASISASLMQELAKYESAEREVRRLLWIIMENESNEEKERLKSRFENAKASGKAFVREMLQASDKEKALEIVKKERRTTDHGVQKFKLEVTKLEKQKKRQQEKEKQEQKKQQEKEKQEQKKQQEKEKQEQKKQQPQKKKKR